MKLHTLKRSTGIVSKSKRLGRGNGSGKGNYSTKGLKGQKSRSGFSMKPFFEWGQTSIVQRIPKSRGFKRHYKLVKEVVIVNLGHLDADVRIVEGMEISKAVLKDFWYIKSVSSHVKLLGNGEWTKKVTFVDIDAFSKSAQEKLTNPAAKKPVEKIEKPKSEKEPAEKKAPAKKSAAKKTVEKVEKTKAEKKPAEKKAPAKKPAAKKTK
jgi:large subunit ribosomal protein L15